MFDYDTETKTFTADWSELSYSGHRFNTMLTIKNERTGGEVTFDIVTVDRDREGDWTAMRFKSTSKEHPDLKLVVFND